MNRYPVLIGIAMVYKVLAYLVGVLGAIGILVGLLYLGSDFRWAFSITIQSIIGGALGVITLLAASESIKVFLDIEENTRRSAELMRGEGPPLGRRSTASNVPTSASRSNIVSADGGFYVGERFFNIYVDAKQYSDQLKMEERPRSNPD